MSYEAFLNQKIGSAKKYDAKADLFRFDFGNKKKKVSNKPKNHRENVDKSSTSKVVETVNINYNPVVLLTRISVPVPNPVVNKSKTRNIKEPKPTNKPAAFGDPSKCNTLTDIVNETNSKPPSAMAESLKKNEGNEDQLPLELVQFPNQNEEMITLTISENESHYMQLQNATLTGNKVSLRKSSIGNYASSMDPKHASLKDVHPGVKVSSVEVSDDFTIGYMLISPKTVVPFQILEDCNNVFWVIDGEVTVRSGAGHYEKSDNFYMFEQTFTTGTSVVFPSWSCCTMENWSNKDALLSYCKTRADDN